MTTFEYAPAPESRSIVTIHPEYGHFINGSFTKGSNHFPTINPADEEVLSRIALGNTQDIDAAVKAARVAYDLVEDAGQRARKIPVPDRTNSSRASA
jgi:aldehyde dehydrogenase (NAD+)